MPEALIKAGRYEIVGELGRGSMGVVYKGHDPVIGRTVAVKTLLTEGLSAPEFQEYKARFQREAQAAGALAHPNIITVYDFGEDSGVLYLAMEYLEGKSLETLVQEQNILPIDTILPIYEQVCSALDHAHQNGVVHRDIKPANIMILQNGFVKVTDFGIAKMMSLGMTQAGQIMGTPNYMSPEQVKGRPVDGRADIFSLGVILYELVTGEKPFGGQNITTVIYKIINQDPIPPRELDASIPPGFNYIVGKALAKNPNERYQTCRELAEDLRKYKELGRELSEEDAPQTTMVLTTTPLIRDPAETAETVKAPAPAEFVKTLAPAPAPAEFVMSPEPAAAPLSLDEVPIGSPARSIAILPPPDRHKGVPQIMWVIGAMVIVAIAGTAGIVFVRRSQRVPPPPPVPKVGLLRVEANIPGAKISVDGRTDPSWMTPYTISDLATGSHDVVISMEGYDKYQQSVNVEGGQTSLVVGTLNPPKVEVEPSPPQNPTETLATGPAAPKVVEPPPSPKPSPPPARHVTPKVGDLEIRANVEGAKISVGGRSEPGWVTPTTIPDLAVGSYNVLISKDGYDDYTQSVTIEGGQTKTISANLSQPEGEVNIRSTPSGLEVLIDGKSYGPTPIHATLRAGEHSVTLNRPGGEPYQSPPLKVQSGSIITKTFVLGGDAGMGAVAVRTIPPGATVLADGQPVGGPTPTIFQLAVGRHTLTIQLSGYLPTRKDVDVLANGTPPVDVPLTHK